MFVENALVLMIPKIGGAPPAPHRPFRSPEHVMYPFNHFYLEFLKCVYTFPQVALARVVWPLPFHRIWSCRTDKAAGLPSSGWSSYARRVTACWPEGWPPRSWSRGVAAAWRGPGRLNNTFFLWVFFINKTSVVELRCLSPTVCHLNHYSGSSI